MGACKTKEIQAYLGIFMYIQTYSKIIQTILQSLTKLIKQYQDINKIGQGKKLI